MGAEGGIAQLGERLHGMQEVIGSIPFTSTKGCRQDLMKSIWQVVKSLLWKFQGLDPIV